MEFKPKYCRQSPKTITCRYCDTEAYELAPYSHYLKLRKMTKMHGTIMEKLMK